MSKLVMTKLDASHASVQGEEFAIENKVTGEVYVSSKKYLDKLFKEMGYKNLNVIKTIKEFAGKVVSEVGETFKSEIYLDEESDSFVVTSGNSIAWINSMFDKFEEKGYQVLDERYDTSNPYAWDQYEVKSSTGTTFFIYTSLLYEKAYVLSANRSSGGLDGLLYEDEYDFNEENSLNELFILMDNPIDISTIYDTEQDLSIQEVIDLACKLDIVKKKKKYYSLTEDGEEYDTDNGLGLERIIEDANSMSWLQRHITKSGFSFSKGCKMIGDYLPFINVWDVKDYYSANYNETSDMFVLNS